MAANPEATFGEVGKLVGAAWKERSDKDKKPYQAEAEKDKAASASIPAARKVFRRLIVLTSVVIGGDSRLEPEPHLSIITP